LGEALKGEGEDEGFSLGEIGLAEGKAEEGVEVKFGEDVI